MKIAILGVGKVGKTLGTVLRASGHSVVYGVREPRRYPESNVKTVAEAIAGVEAVILGTSWTETEAFVCEHVSSLAGKIVIDATN